MSEKVWVITTTSLFMLALFFLGLWLIAHAAVMRLRRMIEGHCDRIAGQSELLSRRVERPFIPAHKAEPFRGVLHDPTSEDAAGRA